jgi:hypothetical protein
MEECKQDEDDGQEGSERWPGGARPSCWRRRASAGGERLAGPPADVGEAEAERGAAAAAREDLELVSRELGVTAGELTAWRDACLAAGEAALKTRPADGRDVEIGRLKAKVGELTMANELLDPRIDRLETHRPLARRRSRL